MSRMCVLDGVVHGDGGGALLKMNKLKTGKRCWVVIYLGAAITGTVAQWSKVLVSDESKFSVSFGNQGPRVWGKSEEAESKLLKNPVWSFHNQWWIWGAMSSAGVGPLCFIKSRVKAAVYQEILERFMLLSADKLYRDADFLFQQDLAPAHSAKTTSNWFADRGITVLNWPANSPDLNPIENLRGIVKRKMRPQTQQYRQAEGHYQGNPGFHNTSAVPQADCLHVAPHWCSTHCAKGAPTKYWVYKLTYFSEGWHFCVINPFFDWSC